MQTGIHIGGYQLIRKIGEGGMGEVWLASHDALGRHAAIKVLHADYSHRKEVVARFFNEARAATAIADPGIIQVFDFGHHTDGSAYIVMELLDGEPLDHRVDRSGPLPVPDALRILRQVASALGAAHARGIVHRDLKPENIFLVRDPEVAGGERAKVLDFGIAKLTGDDIALKTVTAAVMGTPIYMSPEQCRGAGQADQRSDVYSLGCVLFRLLVGRPPFDGEGIGDIIAMHLREPAPRISSLRLDVPRDVDDLIARCLAKDPAARFASGTELAAAIDQLPSNAEFSLGRSSRQLPISSTPRPAAVPTTFSGAAGSAITSKPSASRIGLLATGGVLVAAASAALIFVVARSNRSEVVDERPPIAPTQAPRPVLPPVAAPPPPAPIDAAVAPVDTKGPMLEAVARFAVWSRGHAGAPCPTSRDVAGDAGDLLDAWSHPMTMTCTAQPSDQMIGLVSAGPDGKAGTADDIASWNTSPEIAALLHGPRWGRPVHREGPPTPAPPPAPAPAKPKPTRDLYDIR